MTVVGDSTGQAVATGSKLAEFQFEVHNAGDWVLVICRDFDETKADVEAGCLRQLGRNGVKSHARVTCSHRFGDELRGQLATKTAPAELWPDVKSLHLANV